MKRQPPRLPAEAQQETPIPEDTPVFFYMPDTTNGEFCQWYPSTFTVSKVLRTDFRGTSRMWVIRLVNAVCALATAEFLAERSCAAFLLLYLDILPFRI